jgi:hypothetical protein
MKNEMESCMSQIKSAEKTLISLIKEKKSAFFCVYLRPVPPQLNVVWQKGL